MLIFQLVLKGFLAKMFKNLMKNNKRAPANTAVDTGAVSPCGGSVDSFDLFENPIAGKLLGN